MFQASCARVCTGQRRLDSLVLVLQSYLYFLVALDVVHALHVVGTLEQPLVILAACELQLLLHVLRCTLEQMVEDVEVTFVLRLEDNSRLQKTYISSDTHAKHSAPPSRANRRR